MITDLSNAVGVDSDESSERSKRGFGTMTEERRRKIAALGGSSVPKSKRSFSKDHDLAVRAGRLGGKARQAKRSET
jgi:hypothetical protein